MSVRYITGDILDAPLDGAFNYIDCCGVLHHLSDPAAGARRLCELPRARRRSRRRGPCTARGCTSSIRCNQRSGLCSGIVRTTSRLSQRRWSLRSSPRPTGFSATLPRRPQGQRRGLLRPSASDNRPSVLGGQADRDAGGRRPPRRGNGRADEVQPGAPSAEGVRGSQSRSDLRHRLVLPSCRGADRLDQEHFFCAGRTADPSPV
jgi:hypothetical protein